MSTTPPTTWRSTRTAWCRPLAEHTYRYLVEAELRGLAGDAPGQFAALEDALSRASNSEERERIAQKLAAAQPVSNDG